jgi:hypothetical protein
MCRRFCGNFLWKSRLLWQIWLASRFMSEYLSEYLLLYVRALDRCYQHTALWARRATSIEVCNRSAHCEGINGRQPHDLSTLLLLAAPTRSAHGRAGATGSVRHKRVRCNSDTHTAILTHYSVSYLILLTCPRVDKMTKWQNLVKLNFGSELKFTHFLCCWRLEISLLDSLQRLARSVCDDRKTRHSSTWIVMSTIPVVWLVSSLPSFFYTMPSHRDIVLPPGPVWSE